MADTQRDAPYPHGLETGDSLFRHACRKIHEAVIVADVDVSDVAAVEASFIRNGTNDVSGLDAVRVADLDTIGFEPLILPR